MNCHSGAVNTGPRSVSINIAGDAAGFMPGQTYSITVRIPNSTASEAGFSMVCLNPALSNSGTFTSGSGTRIVTNPQNGRFYINHSGTALRTWNFTWTAPTTNVPDSVTFYAAARETVPGDFTNNGKKVFKRKIITGNPITNRQENTIVPFPNPVRSGILRFSSLRPVAYALYILQGISIKTGTAAAGENIDLSGVPSGIYLWKAISDKEIQNGNLIIQN